MPFQRRHGAYDRYSWESKAEKGEEFVEPISSNGAFVHWTRALRAVSKGGVLVVRYHGKPRAVLTSPQILRDILFYWRGLIGTNVHPAVEQELTFLALSRLNPRLLPLRPRLIGVRAHPRVAAFVCRLAEEGGLAFVMRYGRAYACLVPIELLTRFKTQAREPSGWTDQVLNWICSLQSNQVRERSRIRRGNVVE